MLTDTQKKCQKKWKEANVKISRELRDIIHGYIMSDGYVNVNGCLTVDQSQQQAKFVEWLYNKLESVRTPNRITQVTRTDKRNGKKTYSMRFYTKTLLTGFRFMWYKTSKIEQAAKANANAQLTHPTKKCLPKSLHCFLNSTFISLWFAGDGTKVRDSRASKIEVTAFTPEERRQLQKLFKEKFDLSVEINRAGKSNTGVEQWTLNINAGQYDKFRDIITKMDLIPNIFPHKLHSNQRKS